MESGAENIKDSKKETGEWSVIKQDKQEPIKW